jgi:hypothetical protein
MNIFNMKNLRKGSAPSGVEPIADLDALIQAPIPFKCLGRIHYLKPVSTQVFFEVTNALARMSTMKDQAGDLGEDQLLDLYFGLFSAVCDSISRADLKRMSQAQCAALLQLVIDTITGKVHADIEEKKKTGSHQEIVRLKEDTQPQS